MPMTISSGNFFFSCIMANPCPQPISRTVIVLPCRTHFPRIFTMGPNLDCTDHSPLVLISASGYGIIQCFVKLHLFFELVTPFGIPDIIFDSNDGINGENKIFLKPLRASGHISCKQNDFRTVASARISTESNKGS